MSLQVTEQQPVPVAIPAQAQKQQTTVSHLKQGYRGMGNFMGELSTARKAYEYACRNLGTSGT